MGYTSVRDVNLEWNNFAKAKDRKAYLDAQWNGVKVVEWDSAKQRSHVTSDYYQVVKSSMVGTTYYAAIARQDVKGNVKKIFAVIALTSMADAEFSFKEMQETEMPFAFDCPKTILKQLTPTTNKNSLKWRKRCKQQVRKKQLLNEAAKNGYNVIAYNNEYFYDTLSKKWLRSEGERYYYILKKDILATDYVVIA